MNAIITGATKGIGWEVAKKFAENNINLVLCSRNIEELNVVEENLAKINQNIKIYVFESDLSEKQQTLAFADFCLNSFDQIDILVNNAGVFLPGILMDENNGALETMIDTNLYSAYHLSRKIVPTMIERRSGFIINIASIASIMAYPGGGSYTISKFALRGFSKVLREELKEYNIKVTTVMPGATWSNTWAGVDLPKERLMQASDIAESIWTVFKLSPSAVIEEITIRPQLGDL